MANVFMRMTDWLKAKWPLVMKSTLESERNRLLRMAERADAHHGERMAEANKKAAAVVAGLSKLQPIKGTFGYMLNVQLDDRMIEFAAQDKGYWRYLSELVARNVERELATMNFGKFASKAHRFENERRDSYSPRFEP